MAAGTITVNLHATLHSVSQIKNEIVDNQFKNNINNNNRINCEDRNVQTFNVKSVGKNLENVLTVAQQPTSTTNAAAVEGESNAASATKSASKDKTSSKKRRNDGDATPELLRCKRRINFTQLGYNIPQAAPTSVARRNERERNRVKLVNLGFATLREHVPNGSKNKKMSKVDTLRSAVEYIRKLQQLLADEEDDDDEDEDEENGEVGSSRGGGDNNGGGGSSTIGSPYTDSTVDSPTIHAAENLPPTHGHHHQFHADNYSSSAARNHHHQCPPPSLSPNCSVSSSPSPSHASDYSSYEPLSPEEEDLLDFTSWFT